MNEVDRNIEIVNEIEVAAAALHPDAHRDFIRWLICDYRDGHGKTVYERATPEYRERMNRYAAGDVVWARSEPFPKLHTPDEAIHTAALHYASTNTPYHIRCIMACIAVRNAEGLMLMASSIRDKLKSMGETSVYCHPKPTTP